MTSEKGNTILAVTRNLNEAQATRSSQARKLANTSEHTTLGHSPLHYHYHRLNITYPLPLQRWYLERFRRP
jgi:hypothetical protein